VSATIYKYPLDLTDVQKVAMPTDARLLYVAMQNGQLTLWAHVDTDLFTAHRLIAVIGTGNPAPELDEGVYVGTAFDGPFVWHVFDGGEL
jgi:hypothetical protein